jgi:hypothetical protein
VIDAVDRDLPFNRFIAEQIAGDLLPATTDAERDRLLTATGFLALGVKDVNQRFKTRFVMDNVDEQIDTVSRSVLALTVSCARCHDHKFDPIPTTDYYALAGIFTSTQDCAGLRNKMGGSGLAYYVPTQLVRLSGEFTAPPEAEVAELQRAVDEAKEAFDEIRGTPAGMAKGDDGLPLQRSLRQKHTKLQNELLELTDPAARGQAVHGVRESAQIADTEVRLRGEAERLGPVVPRGFLTAFQVPGAPTVNREQSGRLELAQWLSSDRNPLTARVYVNRIWKQLFGEGLVSTVDNFGIKGAPPSHPELLDYLASEFIRDGWSTKRLIRRLALTHTYQLGSEAPELAKARDPGNRLLWRHAPRRLEAEEIRDAILAVSGSLQLDKPSAAASQALKMIELRDNGAEARTLHQAADAARHRSIYLPLLRGITPKALAAFDPVSQTFVSGQRDSTTVPTQALYLLNGPFIREQALALAGRIVAGADRFDAEWIREIYVRALARSPSDQEVARAEKFLASFAAAWRDERTRPGKGQPAPPSAEQAITEEKPPDNPDDVDRRDLTSGEKAIEPPTPKAAAWMSLVQSLLASAEFRFVR